MKRREFLKTTASTALTLGAAGSMSPELIGQNILKGEIPRRPLGKRIGFEASILGLGAAYIGLKEVTHEDAIKVINYLIDNGVNYMDTAPAYNNSQEKLGMVMKTRRKEVFLATKVSPRDAQGATLELEKNLQLLQTDVIDLIQFHGVTEYQDLEKILGPGGALEAMVKARKEGKVRFIGISNHKAPEVMMRALKSYDFDSILCAISAADVHYHDFVKEVVPFARKQGAAVIAMKVIVSGAAKGRIIDYIRYAVSLPIDVAIVGSQTMAHAEESLQAVRNFKPMTDQEKWALEQEAKSIATPEIMWWKRRA